jgi:hypothetical protein
MHRLYELIRRLTVVRGQVLLSGCTAYVLQSGAPIRVPIPSKFSKANQLCLAL